MKKRAPSPDKSSPAKGEKSKIAGDSKARAKRVPRKLPIHRSVEYFDLNSAPGMPRRLSTTDLTSAGRSFVSVFHVPDRDTLFETVRLAHESPHAGHPTMAVVSPEIFNDPELRGTIVNGFGEVMVADSKKFDPKQARELLEANRRACREQFWSPRPGTWGKPGEVEFTHTALSARLRDENGRLDARKLSELLGISMTDLATKVCRVSKQALSQSPTSAGIQEKLQPLEDVAQLLHWCGGDEVKLRAWLNRPNSDFPKIEGKTPTPIDLILLRRAVVVASKVHNLRTGHPA